MLRAEVCRNRSPGAAAIVLAVAVIAAGACSGDAASRAEDGRASTPSSILEVEGVGAEQETAPDVPAEFATDLPCEHVEPIRASVARSGDVVYAVLPCLGLAPPDWLRPSPRIVEEGRDPIQLALDATVGPIADDERRDGFRAVGWPAGTTVGYRFDGAALLVDIDPSSAELEHVLAFDHWVRALWIAGEQFEGVADVTVTFGGERLCALDGGCFDP